MENTLENKAKFFALYWGQKVFCSVLFGNIVKCESYYLHKDNIQIADYLTLKNLSSISDEHAIEISKLNGAEPTSDQIHLGKEVAKDFINGDYWILTWQVVDYLRSKGYYIGEGNEIDYGWVDLT